SNREKNTDNTLRQLYSVFYHVFVIDGNEMTASLVYGNETVSQVQNIPCDELFKRFGDSYVYSDDRQEYLTFTDLSTVDDRLAALGSDFCERYIRVKDDTGDVSWSLMTIIRTGEKKYIMTARKTSGESALAYEVFRKSGKKASAISSDENPLWDSFRTGVPFGVFWKDRKRRYLGCNRYFLDYYGFESEDEIVGKTDEDIGWFIHPDKFREDELRVLRDGVISVNVSGSCITRGKVREIILTEMPVRDKSGHITGVLGFFRDNQTAGLTNDEKNLLTNLSRTDDLSGLQNSVGMRIDYMHYEDEYRIKKTDFAEIRISITNFDDLENMYGSLFIEKVIRVVGDNLTLVCGRAASLSRLSGGEFILLKQSGDKAEIEKMIEEINSAFTNAQEIDGISFTVFLKAEYSFYSEKEDENSKSKLISDKMMVETIIRRMFGNRFECMALINSHTMMMYYQYFGVNIPAERWQRYGDVRNGVPAAHVMEAASKLWVAPDERERMYSLTKPNALLAEMADKDQYTIKVKVPNPNLEGAPLWKQMRFSWLDDEHEWILYDQTDITESVRLESAHIAEFAEKVQETQDLLEREQQHAIWEHAKAEALMQIPGTVSFDYNPESDVLEINLCNEDGSMENIRMSGYLRTENGRDWVTPECRKADDKIWEKALRGEYRGSFEIEGCFPGKKSAWYKIILRSVTDSEGNVFRVVGRAENIQHYISTASKWRERATEDSLTGLLNHSYVIDSIQNSIADGKGGTILMFDIDKFKDYNDTYGHRYGDEILKKISEIMRGFFRSTDILGRYGGDEFVVFLPEFKNKVMVEKRLKSFVKLLSSLRGRDGERISVSVGAYIDDGSVTDVEKLIDIADRLMYSVKRKGGGDYEIK
nr:diguanylate cyclase [Clostridiales bacterium]